MFTLKKILSGFISVATLVIASSNAEAFSFTLGDIVNAVTHSGSNQTAYSGSVDQKNSLPQGTSPPSSFDDLITIDSNIVGKKLFVRWSNGQLDKALFRYFDDNQKLLSMAGVDIVWIPLPTDNSMSYKTADSCFENYESFKKCNFDPADGQSNSLNSAGSIMNRNITILSQLASTHGFRISQFMWKNGSVWGASDEYLTNSATGELLGTETLGKVLKISGLLTSNLHSLLSSSNSIAQPGLNISGDHVLYIFWDPNCSVCYNLFEKVNSNIAKIKRANKKLIIRWIPVGIFASSSMNKSSQALRGFTYMTRNEKYYNMPNESGGLPDSKYDGHINDAIYNTHIFDLLGFTGTPGFAWNSHGQWHTVTGGSSELNKFVKSF